MVFLIPFRVFRTIFVFSETFFGAISFCIASLLGSMVHRSTAALSVPSPANGCQLLPKGHAVAVFAAAAPQHMNFMPTNPSLTLDLSHSPPPV